MKVEFWPKKGVFLPKVMRLGKLTDGVYVLYVEFEKPKRFFSVPGMGWDEKSGFVSILLVSREDDSVCTIDVRPETEEEKKEFDTGFHVFTEDGRYTLTAVLVHYDKMREALKKGEVKQWSS